MARGTFEVRPIVAGMAVLVADLHGHLRQQGNVYWRVPFADSRVARFVLGRAGRGEGDFVPFDEVIRRYGDLAEVPGEPEPAAPEDLALARLLAAHAPAGGRGLEVGTGVGRGAFVLRGFLDLVLGVDRSAARVRRARNLAATQADFFIPSPVEGGRREVRLDLDRLVRDGVDFAVADAHRLPLADGALHVVVLRSGDGRGPWPDAVAALAEARRVLVPGGLLVLDPELARALAGADLLGADGPLSAYRRP